nr:hypothetical protein GCM10020185_86050 [Pseudomonas brassicacearum subsp. brassicacearum]
MAELTLDPAVPLSAIAKKAGVGQGTFYRHFANREELVFEVYQFEMQQVASLAEQLLATKKPLRRPSESGWTASLNMQ